MLWGKKCLLRSLIMCLNNAYFGKSVIKLICGKYKINKGLGLADKRRNDIAASKKRFYTSPNYIQAGLFIGLFLKTFRNS